MSMFVFLFGLWTLSVEGLRNNVCNRWSDYSNKDFSPFCFYNPDVGANSIQLAERYNYQIQTHKVITEDGYILTVYRIANSTTSFGIGLQPVFLLHGTISSSEIWMQNGLESIPFVLANIGFDVWLGNTRGNYNSPSHADANITPMEYWNNTFDDLVKDVPAVLDYIAENTNKAGEIVYIGHSAGALEAVAYASDRPEHAKKNLKAIIGIAPAVYLPKEQFMVNLVRLILRFNLVKFDIKSNVFHEICTTNVVTISLCRTFVYLLFGNSRIDDPAQFIVTVRTFPDRVALKPFVQYIQFADSGEFKKFDYGKTANLMMYGQETPPKYDLGRITVPFHSFIGASDTLVTEQNCLKLHNELNVENSLRVIQDYDHISFFTANNTHDMFLVPLLKLMERLRT
ncbi:PREDICTED: gastric triacylglycerol lipase-like [Nicrophorus vespilloides]|uniref:Lipase n=1 Tax=Nicrophorus vespilloides TaxID=110193 RepID=A0ABM1MU07_NICVS|nr:PREDICTED: gastric triacylglycerol lipase-like [Nicrophorus vespilloides]